MGYIQHDNRFGMSIDGTTHMRSRTIDVQCTLGRKGKAGRRPLGTVDASGDVLRIPIESRSSKYRQVASAWHVWVRTPAAAEYVRRRQAELMRELDGMCLDLASAGELQCPHCGSISVPLAEHTCPYRK